MGKSDPGPAPQYKGQYYDSNNRTFSGGYKTYEANDPNRPADAVYVPGLDEREFQAGKDATQATNLANRPNISTPWANESWSQGPNGSWTLSNHLNPDMEASVSALTAQMRNQPQMTGTDARNKAIAQAQGEFTGELNPVWDQRQGQASQDLLNQGLSDSSDAYSSGMADVAGQRADAYSTANNAAIGQGTAEGQQMFARNMAMQQQPMEMLQGLYGFGRMPTFNSAASWQPANYMDAARSGDQANLDLVAGQNQASADAFQGLMSLGKSAAGARGTSGGGYRGSVDNGRGISVD